MTPEEGHQFIQDKLDAYVTIDLDGFPPNPIEEVFGNFVQNYFKPKIWSAAEPFADMTFGQVYAGEKNISEPLVRLTYRHVFGYIHEIVQTKGYNLEEVFAVAGRYMYQKEEDTIFLVRVATDVVSTLLSEGYQWDDITR